MAKTTKKTRRELVGRLRGLGLRKQLAEKIADRASSVKGQLPEATRGALKDVIARVEDLGGEVVKKRTRRDRAAGAVTEGVKTSKEEAKQQAKAARKEAKKAARKARKKAEKTARKARRKAAKRAEKARMKAEQDAAEAAAKEARKAEKKAAKKAAKRAGSEAAEAESKSAAAAA